MSMLLNAYIDMELKTSNVNDSSKIAAKILAALYIYLSKCNNNFIQTNFVDRCV